MAKFDLRTDADRQRAVFFCPACEEPHGIWTAGPGAWQFNGDAEFPTVTPSILCTGGEDRCHSYITNGKIQFLPDSTHQLAGQTVDLPEWESAWQEWTES